MKYHLVPKMLILLCKSDGLWRGGAAVVGAACSRGGEGCILIPKMLNLLSKSDG